MNAPVAGGALAKPNVVSTFEPKVGRRQEQGVGTSVGGKNLLSPELSGRG